MFKITLNNNNLKKKILEIHNRVRIKLINKIIPNKTYNKLFNRIKLNILTFSMIIFKNLIKIKIKIIKLKIINI